MILSVHARVCACVCVGGGHLCVIANGMQGHLQCRQVESELSVCLKPRGFMMENSLILKNILN